MVDPLVLLLAAAAISAALATPVIRLLRAGGLQTFHWLKRDVDNRLFYQLHQKKIGTPSMGGILMLVPTIVLVAAFVATPEAWLTLGVVVVFALLGLSDDISKAMVKAGLRQDDFAALPKFIVQWGTALGAGLVLTLVFDRTGVALPLVGTLRLGWLYVPLAALVLVASANAANITDGLDGLAGGLAVIAFVALLVIALAVGQLAAASIAAILAGATLGYLFFNVHPAKVFMGDIGSMCLGAGLAMVALLVDSLVAYVIVMGVFAAETASSLAQTIALRRGKRIFRIAPYHHHLEAIGWPETRITQTFWLVGATLAVAGILVAKASLP